MKLEKRDCKIKVTLKPLGAELLYVCFDFGYDRQEFIPSTAAISNEQFGEFVSALYTLFSEKNNDVYDDHSEWHRRTYHCDSDNHIHSKSTAVEWDGEGPRMIIRMTKGIDSEYINIEFSDYGRKNKTYTVNSRDFCYAVAKACTEVIKEFGIYGYRFSTESEPISLHQLLFLKAYALGNTEARELIIVDSDLCCCKSDFNKELELLLFDM